MHVFLLVILTSLRLSLSRLLTFTFCPPLPPPPTGSVRLLSQQERRKSFISTRRGEGAPACTAQTLLGAALRSGLRSTLRSRRPLAATCGMSLG